MLVFVQYEVDSAIEVVEHTTVEGIQPKNVADFDATHSYDVWWNGNATVDGGYYKATVFHMTETQDEIDLYLSKRPRKAMNLSEGNGKKEDEVRERLWLHVAPENCLCQSKTHLKIYFCAAAPHHRSQMSLTLLSLLRRHEAFSDAIVWAALEPYACLNACPGR
ncbi:hypothetical protein HPB52_005176 [Rhipicephalus sanguineus]|uniref:Uncharacterized protein n=1 Tax=Rhipicephalus sanguineus TaxID=34632 RepID=A0A9D4PCM7_RHISA|nr:hypothetical protein HPB52_005176 [Rhipicephalus sanguineus]